MQNQLKHEPPEQTQASGEPPVVPPAQAIARPDTHSAGQAAGHSAGQAAGQAATQPDIQSNIQSDAQSDTQSDTQSKKPPVELPENPDVRVNSTDELFEPKRRSLRLFNWQLPKWWPYGLAGLGIAGAIALAFRPAPVPADIGQVTRGPLQVTIAAEGKTRVKERFVVAAPVTGRLQRIDLDVGDRVAAGELIAQIDPLPLSTQVQAAQAKLRELQAQISGVETQRPKSQALAQAQAQLRSAQAAQQAAKARVASAAAQRDQASKDRDRTAQLESQGAVSRRELEVAETLENTRQRELEAARQQLTQSEQAVAAATEEIPRLQSQRRDPDYLLDVYQAQIAAVEAELANLVDEAARTTIVAPSEGDVLRVVEDSARFVQAGDLLVDIGNAKELELVIDVLSADAVKVQLGSQIKVQQWGGSEPLAASVSAVEPAAFTEISALGVEEQRVNIIGQLADSAASLGDGYRVEAEIVVWQTDDAIQVPVSALFRCDGGWCVFTVEEQRAQRQRIEVGRKNPFDAVVLAGLEVGESVVLHPNERIEPGSRVRER